MKAMSGRLKMVKSFAVITLGCVLYALAFNWFFQPNALSFGGLTGIAQILNRFFPGLPVGLTVFVLNIPLFILGVRRLGWKLLVSSLYAIALSSLLIDALGLFHTFQPIEPLLACLYGGVTLGVALGMMIMVGATTGGTDLAARLLKSRARHVSMGRLCLAIDVAVIVLYALTFQNINNALYGMVAVYISSLAMDMVIYGSATAKMAYIISDNSEKITECLLKMNLGVTLLGGQGGFSGGEKHVVLCAFKRSHVAAIKAAVTEIDPNAFIIVCEAHEILGEGFGAYDPNGL